jgi:hypothetical protein
MNKWINVTEKLPDDYVEVLYLAVNDSGTKERMTGHRENGKWKHCCMFYSTITFNEDFIKVTHWMPLTEMPI